MPKESLLNRAPEITIELLERQLRDGFARLRFAPELETPFCQDHAQSMVTRRLVLIGTAIVLIAITPLLDALVLHPPAGFVALSRYAQFGLMIPALIVAGIVTPIEKLWRWADPVAATVAILVCGGLLFQRNIGADFGYVVPAELIAATLVGTAVMAGLRTIYYVIVAVTVLVAFVANEIASYGTAPPVPYALTALFMLTLICVVGAYVSEHVNRASWLHYKLMRELSVRDHLTGLANTRAFRDAYPRLHATAARSNCALTVAMVDVDNFKAFNDRYGHPAGDECLRQIARVLATHSRRATDLQARTGGEEFTLVWYDLGRANAADVVESLRAAIERLGIPHAGTTTGAGVVTISIGAVCVWPRGSVSADQLLKEADEQLYVAKQSGRNRISLAFPDDARDLIAVESERILATA